MSYYAKIDENMITIAVSVNGTDYTQKTLPVGTQLLDFMYYDAKELSRQIDMVLAIYATGSRTDVEDMISHLNNANNYVAMFSELLVDTLTEGNWTTRQGFDSLCKTYPQEVALMKERPEFAKLTHKTAGRSFLVGLFSFHAIGLKQFLKSQLEFCMNSANDEAVRDLNPMQRLYLYEQWRKSRGEQPLYFEAETYPSRMLVDKQLSFPVDGSLNDWAELLKQENPAITEMAELGNGYALMRYEMMHTVMQNVQIKLCANCGRYFINTGRSDKEYCPRPIDGQPDKTCESMGALLKHKNKAKSSEIIREYNTAYKRANSSKRIGNLTDKEFAAWSKEAREKRELCLSGELSREDFTEWLNRDRIYRKRA